MNKKAQLGFGLGPKKKKRVRPSRSEKNEIWDKQDGECYKCGTRVSPSIAEYHHKDGNPSNWKLSNLALVCANCHKKETNLQRVRKVQKKRREKEAREKDPLGMGSMFKAPRRKKEPSLFGGGDIFGAPKKGKSKKAPSLFGESMFGPPKKKKGRKKKGPFDLF